MLVTARALDCTPAWTRGLAGERGFLDSQCGDRAGADHQCGLQGSLGPTSAGRRSGVRRYAAVHTGAAARRKRRVISVRPLLGGVSFRERLVAVEAPAARVGAALVLIALFATPHGGRFSTQFDPSLLSAAPHMLEVREAGSPI